MRIPALASMFRHIDASDNTTTVRDYIDNHEAAFRKRQGAPRKLIKGIKVDFFKLNHIDLTDNISPFTPIPSILITEIRRIQDRPIPYEFSDRRFEVRIMPK